MTSVLECALPPPPPPPAPPRPAPPPPLPSDISLHPSTKSKKPLITGDLWPHRLLHVDTMTSHVRSGTSTYNECEAPDYNIMSYTWGYYEDTNRTEEALKVNGVDWPIPSIKRSHFSAETFKAAIVRVVQGVKHRCEWVWVDIACIPQRHPGESEEAKALRGQEIGRQVEIFYRAKESFVWLSSLKTCHLYGDAERVTTLDDYLEVFNQGGRIQNALHSEEAVRWLLRLDEEAKAMQQWMDRVLSHPWFQSLWTLQEMVLRPDSFILFDDGFLNIYQDDNSTATVGTNGYWTLQIIRHDLLCSVWHRLAEHVDPMLQRISCIASQLPIASQLRSQTIATLPERTVERINSLVDKQIQRGLSALDFKYPHIVYSIASSRRATQIQDRIYGIVQTYGIVCSPSPPGDDDIAKLHALEDEFGKHLVSKSPMLSQMFIHGVKAERPRRSWLINQECKVDDGFWAHFVQKRTECLFQDFTVHETSDNRCLTLSFVGKAWTLSSFIKASHPENVLTNDPNLLFNPGRADDPRYYKGLMLDHHVSRQVLGHIVDYFDCHQSMEEAAEKLHKYYRQGSRHHAAVKDIHTTCSDDEIRVALLGSAFPGITATLAYVGLVLAPSHDYASLNGTCTLSDATSIRPSKVCTWERIGLMRWGESYGHDVASERYRRFDDLPTYHDFQCYIV